MFLPSCCTEKLTTSSHSATPATDCPATDPWQRLELACAAHIGTVVSDDPMAKMSLTSLFAIHEEALQKRLKSDRNNYEKIFRRLIDDLGVPFTCDSSIFRLALLGALNWTRVWFRHGRRPPD